MHVVVAKDLYTYLGSKVETVTEKIIQLTNFIDAMFYKLHTKVLLSSLEFWTDRDRIRTTRKMTELLHRFTEWKYSHLTLRPHDVVFLFMYKEKSDFVGAAFARKLCVRPTSAAVAVYRKEYTLENFSVVVAQLLAVSLGIYFDDSRECQCTESACLMNPKAVLATGVKTFSGCNIKEFQTFLARGQGQCLLNKPRMNAQYRAATCGNGIVEDGEQCDCGSEKQCISNGCCQVNCRLKPGKQCAQGKCCWERSCKLKEHGTLCRDMRDPDCDLKEYCNGSVAACAEDFYVQDGQQCEGQTGACMKGVCWSPHRWCRKMFGKDSKSASSQCYEEINSQKDRMGNCGTTQKGYQNCQWQDLRCGKLVCEYPHNKPFMMANAAVIYARVQNRWCVTLDYVRGPTEKDPILAPDGTGCGINKVCMNQKCVDYATIKPNCNATIQCHGKGVCNNKGNCHCHKGWAPPRCKDRQPGSLGGSIDSMFRSALPVVRGRSRKVVIRNWTLVSFFLFLPAIIGSLVLAVKMKNFLLWRMNEEEEEEEEEDDEGSQEPNQTDTTSV